MQPANAAATLLAFASSLVHICCKWAVMIDRALTSAYIHRLPKESSWAPEDGCCGGGCCGRSHTGPAITMAEDEVCRLLQEKLALRKENENPERPGKEMGFSPPSLSFGK